MSTRIVIFSLGQKECDYFGKCDYLRCDFYECGQYVFFSISWRQLTFFQIGLNGHVINYIISKIIDFNR